SGNRVILTDLLVHTLSTRELEAIVAHELAHLKRGDPRRLSIALIASALGAGVIGAVLPFLPFFKRWEGVISGLSPVLAILGCFGFFLFLRRRIEHATDKSGVTLTHDPEALI